MGGAPVLNVGAAGDTGGAVLEPWRDEIWVAARKQTFWGLETGTKMTVVRLSGGGLFVHCPVRLDDATRRAVDALGPVRAVVAPSLFHHLYVGQWMDAYPDASFHPCPGLERKRAELAWGRGLDGEPGDAWAADLDQAPFTARFEREIVFFDRRTRTMICADAMLNLSRHPSRVTRAVAFLMANTSPGAGYLERIAVRDWKLGRRQLDRILEWDIESVALAHGESIARDGRRVLRDAYHWL